MPRYTYKEGYIIWGLVFLCLAPFTIGITLPFAILFFYFAFKQGKESNKIKKEKPKSYKKPKINKRQRKEAKRKAEQDIITSSNNMKQIPKKPQFCESCGIEITEETKENVGGLYGYDICKMCGNYIGLIKRTRCDHCGRILEAGDSPNCKFCGDWYRKDEETIAQEKAAESLKKFEELKKEGWYD